MTLELAAEHSSRPQFGQEPGGVRKDTRVPGDDEYIEIPEDAYKQNNVYRPWQPRGVNVSDSVQGNVSADSAPSKRKAS